jgi:hypothetical protein
MMLIKALWAFFDVLITRGRIRRLDKRMIYITHENVPSPLRSGVCCTENLLPAKMSRVERTVK